MTPEVFAWDASSNNRQMLAGKSSLVLNAISMTRTAENDKLPIHEKIELAKAAQGPGAAHRARARDGLLRDLEVRREHRRARRSSWSTTSTTSSRRSWRASSTTSPASPRRCRT